MIVKVIKDCSLSHKSFIMLLALAVILLVVAFSPWHHDTRIKASSTTEWSVPITVSAGSEGSDKGLEFGVRELATDGLDSGVDVLHPPPSPGATFDAYFDISGTAPILNQLDEDYRGPANTIDWTLYTISENQDITVTWDATGLPSGYSAYMNTGIDTFDMLGQNALPAPLPSGEHTLGIFIETGDNPTPQTPSPTQTPLPTHTLSPTPTLTQTLIPTATPVSTPSATITPGPPSTPPPPSGSSWSTGAVIGIGIGIFVVILLATFSGIWFMRRRRHGSVG